jgi:signal transduction histidine kinase/HPt (histidine-containing phosphotransfer) domain-containing protein
VVLLDLKLPDSQGLTTFDSLARDFPSVPIVVLTGSHAEDESIGVRSIQRGAQDFLSKGELSAQILQRTVHYAIERKQMLRRLEQAQQLAKMGNWELDLESNELVCSATMYSIFEHVSNQSMRSIADYLKAIHPDDQLLVATKLKQACETRSSFKVDHRVLLPHGDLRYVSMQGQMENTPHQGASKMMGTAQDITERTRIETLTREKELATKAAKLRQDFLAKTSHEIRTPLNPILVLTDMLLRTDLTREQREYLDIIRTAGDTLLALVNDVLDLSKIEAGKIEFNFQPFQLTKVFDSIQDMMEINAKEKDLELTIDIDPRLPDLVIGDTVRLTQILLNLVGNAIKFTHEGHIEVSAYESSRSEDSLNIAFSVRDTGIGIPRDKLKIIFESFQQLEGNANRQYGGTGLGLTIVRQLVRLQHGHIDVDSEPGQGSTFSFELRFGLPLAEATPVEEPPVSAQRLPQAPNLRKLDLSLVEGLCVLLVEDNPLNQMVTQKLLNDWGITTDIANNGREGVQQIQQKSYDLVLMDIQMPEMDGYEATRFIRQQLPPPICHIPIVALTANAFSGSDDECMKVGMNDYLSKPIEIGNLFDKIVTHINRSGPSAAPRSPIPPQPQPTGSYPAMAKGSHGTSPAPVFPESDPSTSTELMPQTYTDLSYLTELSGGEPDLVKAAVEKFVDSTPEMLDRLNEHLASQNYKELARAAHKLKSSVAFMGIESIREAIVRVEVVSKSDGPKSELPGLVQQIRSVVQASYRELQDKVASM